MKLLYLDCYMGAVGDMLMAALLALLPEPEAFVERIKPCSAAGRSLAARGTKSAASPACT